MKRKFYKKSADEASVARILNESTDFDTVETLKSICTNIMFSIPKSDEGKVIVITSSSSGEGKTTTCTNLSITFAQTGAKVLLIDCDLRKARVHRYLQLDRADGVTNVLCGFSNLDKAIKKNVRPNLDVLTGGDVPPNPAELFESEAFREMIMELKKRYDYIIVDTPPLAVVTDAAIVMKYSTGVVVVVHRDVTTYDMLDITIGTIRKAEAKLLGAIMLGVEGKGKRYGYKRGNKYGYGYGDAPTERK